MTIDFTGRHYPSDIIMQALRYYLAYKLSYREIKDIFTEALFPKSNEPFAVSVI